MALSKMNKTQDPFNPILGPPLSNLIAVTPVCSTMQITFVGIPGYTYTVQRTDTPNDAATVWADVGICTVNVVGNGAFTDTNPPPGGTYYRTRWP